MSEIELNKIYCESNLETMARMPDGFIDLTVTSPPYDNLRTYNGYEFDFEPIAKELYRVTKKGGVVVWVVGDATINGSETTTSSEQKIYFRKCGFNIHDTMIWKKTNPMPTDSRIPRYVQSFEYMFVFSSGTPVCNHIREKCVSAGRTDFNDYPARRENGNKSFERTISRTRVVRETRVKDNVWEYATNNGSGDGMSIQHPAIFPEQLAIDHIYSWSNRGEIVYDPFSGSGTTIKAAHKLGRRWIGSEISQEYVDLANKRLEPYLAQESLF